MSKIIETDHDAQLSLILNEARISEWKPQFDAIEERLSPHGIGIFSKYAIPAGSPLFNEEPLFTSLKLEEHETKYLKLNSIDFNETSRILDMVKLLSDFSSVPHSEASRKLVMSLFCPCLENIDASFILQLRNIIDFVDSNIRKITCKDEALKFLLICSANAFEVKGDDMKSRTQCLYRKSSKLNHSCDPNCWFFICSKSKCISFRSLRPISKGEEITCCYFDEERWQPSHHRRTVLKNSKWFHCTCLRCQSKFDDCRGFFCPNCCDGEVFLGVEFTNPDNYFHDAVSKCNLCNSYPSASFAYAAIHVEKKFKKEKDIFETLFGTTQCDAMVDKMLSQLNAKVDDLDVSQMKKSNVATPKRHHLVSEFFYLCHDLAKINYQFKKAAACIKKSIEIMDGMYNGLSNRIGWMHEYLGDALALAGGVELSRVLDADYIAALKRYSGDYVRPKNVVPNGDLIIAAREAYRRAQSMLKFVYGQDQDNPAIMSVAKKIAVVEDLRTTTSRTDL